MLPPNFEQESFCFQISAVQAVFGDCSRNLFHSVARVAWHRGHLWVYKWVSYDFACCDLWLKLWNWELWTKVTTEVTLLSASKPTLVDVWYDPSMQ